MSAGVNRVTGHALAGFAHVQQSLNVIFTTRLTQRVLRRTFGFAGVKLLGQPLTPDQVMRFYMAIVIAVELWEPRFAVTSLSYPGAQNSAANLGQGKLGVLIEGEFMPNALEGDFSVAANVSVTL